MQKEKNQKRKCIGVDAFSENETLKNLNNPYGYDFCYTGISIATDNYKKVHHIVNSEYFDKK